MRSQKRPLSPGQDGIPGSGSHSHPPSDVQKPHVCGVCEAPFDTDVALKRHMPKHGDDNLCQKPGCPLAENGRPKGFRSNAELVRHWHDVHNIHSDKCMKYKCRVDGCPKSAHIYPRRWNYLKHVDVFHQNEDRASLVKAAELPCSVVQAQEDMAHPTEGQPMPPPASVVESPASAKRVQRIAGQHQLQPEYPSTPTTDKGKAIESLELDQSATEELSLPGLEQGKSPAAKDQQYGKMTESVVKLYEVLATVKPLAPESGPDDSHAGPSTFPRPQSDTVSTPFDSRINEVLSISRYSDNDLVRTVMTVVTTQQGHWTALDGRTLEAASLVPLSVRIPMIEKVIGEWKAYIVAQVDHRLDHILRLTVIQSASDSWVSPSDLEAMSAGAAVDPSLEHPRAGLRVGNDQVMGGGAKPPPNDEFDNFFDWSLTQPEAPYVMPDAQPRRDYFDPIAALSSIAPSPPNAFHPGFNALGRAYDVPSMSVSAAASGHGFSSGASLPTSRRSFVDEGYVSCPSYLDLLDEGCCIKCGQSLDDHRSE